MGTPVLCFDTRLAARNRNKIFIAGKVYEFVGLVTGMILNNFPLVSHFLLFINLQCEVNFTKMPDYVVNFTILGGFILKCFLESIREYLYFHKIQTVKKNAPFCESGSHFALKPL